jgi:outer membrane protein assembly factor BamB
LKIGKGLAFIIFVVLFPLAISSCGILRDFYESQQDYLVGQHFLESSNEFEVIWNMSDIRISHSNRRPTLIGGTNKIVVEGLKKNNILSGTIFGLDSATGNIIWHIPGTGSGSGEKVIQENVLFRGTAGTATIQSYNLENGELIWQTELPSAHSVMDIYYAEKKIFAYTSDDEFYILNEQGEILDSSHVASGMFLVMGGVLYKDDVYSITAINFSSDKELWRLEIGERYTYAPVFDNGTIFLRTSANSASIYSIDQSTGKVHWKLSQDLLSNLYVAGNKIYFISFEGYLVTIDRYLGSEVSKVKFTPSFDSNKQAGDYFVTGDPTNNVLVISFGDNTQIMGLKILNP